MNKAILALALMFVVPVQGQSNHEPTVTQNGAPVQPSKAEQLTDTQNNIRILQQQQRLYFNMLRDLTEFRAYVQTRDSLDELNRKAQELQEEIKTEGLKAKEKR